MLRLGPTAPENKINIGRTIPFERLKRILEQPIKQPKLQPEPGRPSCRVDIMPRYTSQSAPSIRLAKNGQTYPAYYKSLIAIAPRRR